MFTFILFIVTYINYLENVCADEEVASSQWADMREKLRKILEAYEKRVDRDTLTCQLLQSHTRHEGFSLVTPKAASLVQLLSEYRVLFMLPGLKLW